MTKPRWATSPRLWEQAKTAIRKQYGINTGDRFKELVEAKYFILGGGVNRPSFATKSLGELEAEK